ncbi:hypothetical protein JTB14_016654 [Gonioctena quinquepunctata]|nr:hypothetical protein JTB14_016654 [Gonioctena quinquepunctata]
MSFLLPHVKGRKSRTNVCSEEIDENSECGGEINTESHFEQTEEQTLEDNSYESPTSPSSSLPNTPQYCSSLVFRTSIRNKTDNLFALLESLNFPSIILLTEHWCKAEEPIHIPEDSVISRYSEAAHPMDKLPS